MPNFVEITENLPMRKEQRDRFGFVYKKSGQMVVYIDHHQGKIMGQGCRSQFRDTGGKCWKSDKYQYNHV